MARQITNYQDLQDAVADYLNRTDLTQQIELFIYLAERKIFRWYRMANNEKLVAYDMRRNPDTSPGSTELAILNQIDLPDDYLETHTLRVTPWDSTANGAVLPEKTGRPLRRVSLTELHWLQHNSRRGSVVRTGQPEVFARQRDALYVFPEIDSNSDWYWEWIYYCDLTGLFDTPTSDTNVLKTAPDLYLYGALLEAEPFLKPEDEAMQMLPIWKSMWEEAKQRIIEQMDREEFSGSVNEINNVFGGGRGWSNSREGWA